MIITLPDGTEEEHSSDDDGYIYIDSTNQGSFGISDEWKGDLSFNTLDFVGMGTSPIQRPASPPGGGASQTSSTSSQSASATSPQPSSGSSATRQGNTTTPADKPRWKRNGPFTIVEIDPHKVQKSETIKSLAGSNKMTWQDLSNFNWGTCNPDEINIRLRDDVGCTKKTADKKNYIFDDSDVPGIVYIPHPWTQSGLANGQQHTIRVRFAEHFRIVLENDHGIRIPEAAYKATLADGNVIQGQLGMGGSNVLENPPVGPVLIEFTDTEDVEAKSLAANAREAFENHHYLNVFTLLKRPPAIVQKAVTAYDAYFNTIGGQGFVEDVRQHIVNHPEKEMVLFLMAMADLIQPSVIERT